MSPSHISLAAETFDPWKVQAVSRHLADHPLLQIDALIEPSKPGPFVALLDVASVTTDSPMPRRETETRNRDGR